MSLAEAPAAVDPIYQALNRRDHRAARRRLPADGAHRAAARAERLLDPGRRGGPVVARRDVVVISASLGGTFGEEGLAVTLWHWIPAGDFVVDVGFFVDNLTAVLLIVVTTIGMLVHVYSIGYMRHDPGYWRFFAYLNLFMVSMLLLVLADNWLLLFVAWEVVGLSSYLLIGFWYRKRSGRGGQQEGLHHEPRRRRRVRARDHGDLPEHPRPRRADAQHPRLDRAPRAVRRGHRGPGWRGRPADPDWPSSRC